MTMLDPKALEAAAKAIRTDIWESEPNPTTERYVAGLRQEEMDQAAAAITAYLSTITPAEVGGLVERLRATIELTAGSGMSLSLAQWDRASNDILNAAAALEAQAAELAAVKRERDDYLNKAFIANIDKQTAEAQCDEALKALEPFAKIEPSTAVAQDGSEAEPYCVYLACRDRFDFTGADLARARRALTGGKQ